MNFEREVLRSGESSDFRWISNCKQYSICRYTYYQNTKCAPYFEAYRNNDGKRMTPNTKPFKPQHNSLEAARLSLLENIK